MTRLERSLVQSENLTTVQVDWVEMIFFQGDGPSGQLYYLHILATCLYEW